MVVVGWWGEWKISSTLWFVRWIFIQILDCGCLRHRWRIVRFVALLYCCRAVTISLFSHLDLDAGDTIGGSVNAVRGAGVLVLR